MDKLKQMRMKSGLSQAQLSKAAGVPLRTIQMYECGQRNIDNACLDILCKLASTIGCTLFDILEDDALIDRVKEIV